MIPGSPRPWGSTQKQRKNSGAMKIQDKNPRNRDYRWKWMAGATAAATASAAGARAQTTLTLTGNYISATGGNHLNADLGGDGVADVLLSGFFTYVNPGSGRGANGRGVLPQTE
jgi:hypothetical protein